MKTDEQFLIDRLLLCEMDGWKDLLTELQNIAKATQDVETLRNMEDLYFAKGQLSVIKLIESLESTTKRAMEQSSE
jgi:hypothetical protein